MSDIDRSGIGWRMAPSDYARARPAPFAVPARPQSFYVTMRDGCRIAVDAWVPEHADPSPTILLLTPYYRRFQVEPGSGADPIPNAGQFVRYLVTRGYPVVVADVRGTGASFGTRDSFRSPKERDDSAEIADWIVAQPWCDGRIGATGISYVGAACDFLASTGHPAVKAIAPLFAVWDTYADNYFPGGIPLTQLPRAYSDLAVAMDQDQRTLLRTYPYYSDPRLAGPCPVDDDPRGDLLRQALQDHRGNFRQQDFMTEFRFREEPLPYDPSVSSATFSPYAYSPGIRKDVAVLSVSGWYDGAGYANGAISRFLTLRDNPRHLVLGPWDHGARVAVSPWREQHAPQFGLLAMLLRFFDHYLLGMPTGLEAEHPVHTFSLHAERWHGAATWSPVTETWHGSLAEGGRLSGTAGSEGSEEVAVDFGFGSGSGTRYERIAGIGVTAYYEDWQVREAALPGWSSAPLPDPMELTGHGMLVLWLEASEPDGAVFAYVSEVEPDGTVRYVTEGVLRLLHRKESPAPDTYGTTWPFRSYRREDAAPFIGPCQVRVVLLPVSWTFAAGSRIRLSIAGADADHAMQVPHGRPPQWTILRGGETPSALSLPMRRALPG